MNKSDVLDELDHPFFFMAFGVTPFVIGFSLFALWFFKNVNKGGTPGGFGGAARAIQMR
jgi:hypothetical protein